MAFTNAFKSWEPFPKKGLVEVNDTGIEEKSDDDMDESDIDDEEGNL